MKTNSDNSVPMSNSKNFIFFFVFHIIFLETNGKTKFHSPTATTAQALLLQHQHQKRLAILQPRWLRFLPLQYSLLLLLPLLLQLLLLQQQQQRRRQRRQRRQQRQRQQQRQQQQQWQWRCKHLRKNFLRNQSLRSAKTTRTNTLKVTSNPHNLHNTKNRQTQ